MAQSLTPAKATRRRGIVRVFAEKEAMLDNKHGCKGEFMLAMKAEASPDP